MPFTLQVSVCPFGETKHRHSARHKQSIVLMHHDALTGMEKCTPVVPTSFNDLSQLPLNFLLFDIIPSLHNGCSYLHIPTYEQKSCKITNYLYTWALQSVSAINHHLQGDIRKSRVLVFGPWGYWENKYRGHLEIC